MAIHPAPQPDDNNEMKVDSPGYFNKSVAYLEDSDIAVSTEDDVDIDVDAGGDQDVAEAADDQEPPYKRLRTGRDSALSMALKDLSKTRYASARPPYKMQTSHSHPRSATLEARLATAIP